MHRRQNGQSLPGLAHDRDPTLGAVVQVSWHGLGRHLLRDCGWARYAGLVQHHPHAPWLRYQLVQPGMFWVGCDVCRVGGNLPEQNAAAFLAQHAAHRSAAPTHLGAGDVIAAATARLGITPCTPCEERRRLLNQAFPRVLRVLRR